MFDVGCSAFDVFMHSPSGWPGRQLWSLLRLPARSFVRRARRGGLERLQFFADAHQPGAIEHDDQRAGVVQDGGDDGIQIAEGAGRPAAQDEANAEQEILVDDRAPGTAGGAGHCS